MEQIWWERVPNAMAFISDVVGHLVDGKSVVLQYISDIPWHSFMVKAVKDSVRQQNSSKSFEFIPDAGDPGVYLLKEYCKPEKRASYRPSKTYARFFADSDDIVFHDRYFWVDVQSAESLEVWTDFVSDYLKNRKQNEEAAVFIFLYHYEKKVKAKKGLRVCCFDEYVGTYDSIVFSMLASSTVKGSSFMKTYLAELAANILENDIELCAECLRDHQRFVEDPYHTVLRIAGECGRSDGKPFSFCKSAEEVRRGIWQVQIKTIYPALEEYRESFVGKYKDAIQKELPIVSSYGEQYRDPEDVELGTLVYMAGSGKIHLPAQEYEKLNCYKEARNRLSHLSILSLEEIGMLAIL